MELVKLGKKGQVTIPRLLLNKTGIDADTPLMVKATSSGAILLRQVGVYPIEPWVSALLLRCLFFGAPGR